MKTETSLMIMGAYTPYLRLLSEYLADIHNEGVDTESILPKIDKQKELILDMENNDPEIPKTILTRPEALDQLASGQAIYWMALIDMMNSCGYIMDSEVSDTISLYRYFVK